VLVPYYNQKNKQMKLRNNLITTIAILFTSLSIIFAQQSIIMENAVGLKINDYDTTSFWQNINLTEEYNTLSIAVDISHTWINDLEMILTNPEGQSAILFSTLGSGDCFGCEGDDLNIVFQDISTNSYESLNDSCGNSPAYEGDVQAFESLDNLMTGTINGTWTVEIIDFWPGEKGKVNTITMVFDNLIAPLCTSLESPANGSTDIEVNTIISWETSGNATGYKLSLGTSSGGTEILDNLDIGNTNSYNPDTLPCGTTIFVSITPFNIVGEATECTIESFTTESVSASAGDDTEVCFGDSIQLIATGGTTYVWSPPTRLDNPNVANPISTPLETTTYSVMASNENGCFGIDSVTVTVLDEIIIIIDSIYHVRVDRPGFIEISLNDAPENYTYSWGGPNNFSSTEEDVYDLEVGCYTLVVTNILTACTKDTLICIDDLTGINEQIGAKSKITIYPNPASSQISIDFTNSEVKDARISLHELSGKLIKSVEKVNEIIQIDTKELKSGIYLLKIQANDISHFKKIIINNNFAI